MSCTYADGLSPYEHKGILGAAEKFDSAELVKTKCSTLVEYIREAKHIVVHTGAGISTSAGIPDFRGPNGVWTLEEKGLKPNINISFAEAKPTKTHMALKKLVDDGIVHYIVSQNIDGLHLKSGIKREILAELHGNMFIDQCNFCKRQFVRSSPAPTVGQRSSGVQCHGGGTGRKPCRGKLHDTILDWEHSLPDDDLDLSDKHSCMADLSICLGTTLQINPSGNIPLNTLRYGGKMVICNLQPTKHDNKADLIINTFVDNVFEEVMKQLKLEIPEYQIENDPIFISKDKYIEWTISKKLLIQAKTKFKRKCDGGIKRRVLVKREYKIQQDELKLQSKKLKIEEASKLVKIKESKIGRPKMNKIKIPKRGKKSPPNEIICENVIELTTSDEDDVILVNEAGKIHTKKGEEKLSDLKIKSDGILLNANNSDSLEKNINKVNSEEKVPSAIKKDDLNIEIKDNDENLVRIKIENDHLGNSEEFVLDKEGIHKELNIKEEIEDKNKHSMNGVNTEMAATEEIRQGSNHVKDVSELK